jgi:ribosome-binding protein aMBF1 (putative translation factor)
MSAANPWDSINPEVEEEVEEHFEELYERDEEFRKAWNSRRLQRELGDRLLERRLELGYSQRELAEKVGTSQNRIYLIESGEANPTLDTLGKLAEILDARLTVDLTASAS